MSPAAAKTCIYPGCDRPAVPPHPLGGPQPAFCDLEEHNALTAHLERERLERVSHPSPTNAPPLPTAPPPPNCQRIEEPEEDE
jgi:hypothetical protein